jgi:hypothetical protein
MLKVVRHLRANVIAYAALFVALGGTSYAATSLPKNSVGTRQLKPSAVHRSDIASNAVSGSKIAANTLKGADIDESSLGKVPSAASADSATSATNAANATNAADAGKLGGLAPAAFQRGVRWALVNTAGTAIIAQSGGITVSSHPFAGETFVDFGSATAGHAVWAMNSDLDNLASNGAATAGTCGVAPDAYPNCANASHTNHVHVSTHQANGTLADRAFYVFLLP